MSKNYKVEYPCKYCKWKKITCCCSLANDDLYPNFIESLEGLSINDLKSMEEEWKNDMPTSIEKILSIKIRWEWLEKLRDG